jgi:hypothetical protein
MRKWTVGASALAMVLACSQAGAQQGRGGGGRGGGRGGGQAAQGPTTGAGAPAAGQGATVTGQPGKYHIEPLNLHKEALGAGPFAAVARERMRNGDCAGALDAFDQALRSSVDPTLHRDRGLCQERLGNPYPAIDDYRIYVTAEPDAADAEGIRQRLARLEMDVYKHSSAPIESPEEGGGTGATTTATTSSSAGGGVTVGMGAGAPEQPKRDAMETVEHDHDEVLSSIRGGKGFGLAPFFSEHKWITPGSSFGDSTTWSESVGLQVRYSITSRSAFFIEGGWELFNSTSVATISGLTSQLAYELRVPFDAQYDNQLLLGLGLGYEYLVYTPKDASLSGSSAGLFLPRGRVGWRHMLTASVGFDLALDLGISSTSLATSSSFLNTSQPSSTFEVLAANLGIVWGM